jgi:hypothetical protein
LQRSSGRIILICEECGDKMVLIGPEEAWHSRRTLFQCECGEGSTLATGVAKADPTSSSKAEFFTGAFG